MYLLDWGTMGYSAVTVEVSQGTTLPVLGVQTSIHTLHRHEQKVKPPLPTLTLPTLYLVKLSDGPEISHEIT